MVTIYRAVGPNDLADIRSFGGFRPEPEGRSYEFFKLFATRAEDAAWWGQSFPSDTGQEFAIVEVEIPLALYHWRGAGVGAAVAPEGPARPRWPPCPR